MRIWLTLLLLIISCSTYSGEKVVIDYFDKDSIKDTVTIITIEDGHYSIYNLKFAFSSVKRKYNIYAAADAFNFLFIIPIPNEITHVEKYTTIIKEMIGSDKIVEGNADIDWHRSITCHHTTTAHPAVSSAYFFTPVFHKGLPDITTPHLQVLSRDSINCLLKQHSDYKTQSALVNDVQDRKTFKRFIIINFLHNHGPAERIPNLTGPNGEKYFSTKHGIFARKDSGYAWVFINDGILFGTTDLLRRKSIGKIEVVDHSLLLHINGGPAAPINCFVLDLKENALYQMKNDDPSSIEDTAVFDRARSVIAGQRSKK